MAALEGLEEAGLSKIPDLGLAQKRFLLALPKTRALELKVDQNKIKEELLDQIKAGYMAELYKEVCVELNLPVNNSVLEEMQGKNKEELDRLTNAIELAEKNEGESEVREAMVAKCEYLTSIGDKESSLEMLKKTLEKTNTTGHKLDLHFHLIRLGLFFNDNKIITVNLDAAKILIEQGGDWDRRNRLKVYTGLYAMSVRDFKGAADNFLDTVSTFTSYELMDYHTFIKYTIISSMLALDRKDLTKKVVEGADINEQLHDLPLFKSYIFSLHNAQYAEFFVALAEVEDIFKLDRLLAAHTFYYVREMRIRSYAQLLESYSSLTLHYMATSFGVSDKFIDRELSRFIAAGALNAKIDKVGGIIQTNRPDQKNWQYQAVIKQGDLLLNRIQKLSRVITI